MRVGHLPSTGSKNIFLFFLIWEVSQASIWHSVQPSDLAGNLTQLPGSDQVSPFSPPLPSPIQNISVYSLQLASPNFIGQTCMIFLS